MTVIDLRERLALGRLSLSIPSPRRAPEAVVSLEGRELYSQRPARFVIGRLIVLDAAMALAVAVPAALVLGGVVAWQVAVLVVTWSLSLRVAGAYVRSLAMPLRGAAGTVARAVVYLCAAIALASVLVPGLDTGALALVTVAAGASTIVGRRVLSETERPRDAALAPAALVRGACADIALFLERLPKEPHPLFRAVAVQPTDDCLELLAASGDLVLVPRDVDPVQHAELVGAGAVVLLGGQPESSADLRRLVWRLEGRRIGTFLVPVVADLAPPVVTSMPSSGIPVLGITSRDLGAEGGVTKVVVDRLLALVALVVLLPVIALTAAVVKVTSRGPVLFRQVRVGLGGREFEMLKFRTMAADAEARRAELEEQNRHAAGTLFKIADDPRITRVGRVLRKFSLDELPQLVNVLRGEMSLVGPRPPLPAEVAQYPVDAHRRFCVRPGLTGLWQVSGRSDLDPEESMRLDTHYVEQWSPALDVRILAKTPKAVISGDGAY